jgi:2-polyprenyl-3-methyl-5-hydroxy-6-metoxy-1,4-benzoquinol methylase
MTTTLQQPKYWSEPDQNPTLQAELALIQDGSNVLEIGTAAGHVTQALRRKGCEVTGVELDSEGARLASPLCRRMIVGNIEEIDVDVVLPEQFDVILCGDVLEHLKNPEPVLRTLRRRLSATGYLVVSLPHVGHGAVRLSLLAGRFTYMKDGLLDATHLRFFTLHSIVELFNGAGFGIRELHRTRIGLFDTEISLEPSQVPPWAVRRLIQDPEATTYQFIFQAVPSSHRTCLDDLKDTAFDPRREREAFASACMRRAWVAFHRNADRHEARAWTRLAIASTFSVKAALYWLVSLLPFTFWRR